MNDTTTMLLSCLVVTSFLFGMAFWSWGAYCSPVQTQQGLAYRDEVCMVNGDSSNDLKKAEISFFTISAISACICLLYCVWMKKGSISFNPMKLFKKGSSSASVADYDDFFN